MSQPTDNPRDDVRPFKIEVSDRVKRLPPYLFAKINAKKYQMRRDNIDVIDLGMGNPSDPPEDLVVEKLAEAARDPKNHGYSKALGIQNLRREVAAKYQRKYGVRLDPESETSCVLAAKRASATCCWPCSVQVTRDRAGTVLSGARAWCESGRRACDHA